MQIFKKYLNPEELAVGLIHALVWSVFLGLWAVLAVPLSSFLWAWAGADGTSKIWRRLGVPVVICGLIAIAKLTWIPLISVLPLWGVLSIGYGIPDDGDEGSWLGRFWFKKFNDDVMATIFTRGTLALLFGLVLVPLAWISIIWWLIGTVALTLLVPVAVEIV